MRIVIWHVGELQVDIKSKSEIDAGGSILTSIGNESVQVRQIGKYN